MGYDHMSKNDDDVVTTRHVSVPGPMGFMKHKKRDAFRPSHVKSP